MQKNYIDALYDALRDLNRRREEKTLSEYHRELYKSALIITAHTFQEEYNKIHNTNLSAPNCVRAYGKEREEKNGKIYKGTSR